MNKKLLSLVVVSFLLLLNASYAQYSVGGKPFSFTNSDITLSPATFVTMPRVDVNSLKAEDAVNDLSKGPFRFGFNHLVQLNLTNSGTWTSLPNGDRVWQLAVKSKGAQTLNFSFDNFYLPQGASLFIYNSSKDFIIGAFTAINNDASGYFSTDLIAGDAAYVEYYEPAAVANQGHFNLYRITHGYRGVKDYIEKSFGGSGNCQINVNCPLGANWQDEKRGVVCLVVGGSEFCSGSLVNDVPQDAKPYVLTANHCSTSNDFASWVFRFNWEAPTCTNPATNPTSVSLNTSVLRARNAPSDFCLVEITGGLSGGIIPASYTPYFNGWSTIDTPATSAIGIHHPSGDVKKISEAANACISSTWAGTPADSHWQVGQWTSACTEGGSSGSPLFDQNHRIVGQLHGGPSACGQPAANMNDVYGKFAWSWLGGGTAATQLKVWLDPGNTNDTVINGFDPNAVAPSFSFDAGVPSINSPANGYTSCSSSLVPVISLKNYGATTLTSCTVNYQVDAGTVAAYPWTGSLTTGQLTTITLPAITGLSTTSHIFKSFTTNPNGNTEENVVNDSTQSTFSIISPSPVVLTPQTENFETTFPSTDFTIGNPDGNVTWVQSTAAGGFGLSTSSAMMNNDPGSDISGQSDFIYTSYIDFSSAITPLTLTFDVAYAKYNNTYFDSLNVKVSSDCGNTWTKIYGKGSTALSTAPSNTGVFIPTATQWRTETVNLNSYLGQSALRFAFENKSGYGQRLYIDNINITDGTSSIYENNFNSAFNIYPNPSNGFIYINNSLTTTESIKVKVIDVLGKTIAINSFQSNQNKTQSIDLSMLSPGIYFVEITSTTNAITKKINIVK